MDESHTISWYDSLSFDILIVFGMPSVNSELIPIWYEIHTVVFAV